ncbi:hypothetical protein [Bacillus stercoris]|uniref:hypothetical protein n=1 Tax=Bacillus stercoris TaxID=2054641 RepID=UPI003CEBAD5F
MVPIYTVESFHASFNDWYQLEWAGFDLSVAEQRQKELWGFKNRICKWEDGKITKIWEYEGDELIKEDEEYE